ncbi:jg23121, partial [Pararge aegeria aegeria]
MIEATHGKFAVALLQEPYVGGIGKMKSYRGVRIYQSADQGEGTVKAAIAVFQQELEIIQYPKFTTNNIVVVKIRTSAWETTVVSYYFEPNRPIEPYLQHLGKIVKELGTRHIIVGGDANAKNTWWGSVCNDARGVDMEYMLNELDLQVLNVGTLPTFDVIRGNTRYTSCIDVTACSTDLLDRVRRWRVDESVTSSDHNTIAFEIRQKRAKGTL